MDLTGRVWGATPAERSAPYPCDRLVPPPAEGWTRAVDIGAPPGLVFRWLRQLTIAPYSYDRIGFRGRKSPRVLLPEPPELSVGQQFLVFVITDFESDAHITGLLPEDLAARHGPMAVSYRVRSRPGGTRLVVKVVAGSGDAIGSRVRRRLLAWGDLVMMRKQLLTLKRLAEETADSRPPGSCGGAGAA